MPSTYSQICIQLVFAVQNRAALIDVSWEERLYQYITGIVQNKDQKMIAINGTPNHIHIFIGMKPTCCLSDLVREIKNQAMNSLKKEILQNSGSIGRKDMVHFRIANRK